MACNLLGWALGSRLFEVRARDKGSTSVTWGWRTVGLHGLRFGDYLEDHGTY